MLLAFEPWPENIETIKSQLELNQIMNCTVIEAAVSDSAGEVEFCGGPDTSTAHIKRQENERRETHIVKSVTLDEFSTARRPADFVKMDIEGAETIALKGAHELLNSANPPKFMIELHGQAAAQRVCEILERESYSFYTLERARIQSSFVPPHVLALPNKTIA